MKSHNHIFLRIPLVPLSSLFLSVLMMVSLEGRAYPLQSSVSVNPLILLKDGTVAACGLRVLAGPSDQRVLVEVKVEHKQGKNIFSVRARAESPAKDTALSELQLTTVSLDTRSLFPKGVIDSEGYFLLQSALNDTEGAQLMQELLVSGGEFHLTPRKGQTYSIELPRPLSHSLRLAYLNCAGDLIGPEPE